MIGYLPWERVCIYEYNYQPDRLDLGHSMLKKIKQVIHSVKAKLRISKPIS